MVRRSRDAKFIIYQVLYIFVVTVLALKGAEINLGEVVSKDKVVEKSVRDSLVHVVDSLSALGLKLNIQIDTNVISENKELRKKLLNLNTQVASLTQKVKEIPIVNKEKEIIPETKKETIPSPFSSKQEFLQFATNFAENTGDYEVSIIDRANNNSLITKILPKQKVEFELKDQKEVVLVYGHQEEIIKVKNNLPPEIKIEKVTTKMDKSIIYAKELQRTTCFNVKITDERPEQIKVTFTGPITVGKPLKDNKGNIIYNVSLNIANTEDKFNEWTDRNNHLKDSEGRYKANFFFTAFDNKSKQKIEMGESFYFTEFSK